MAEFLLELFSEEIPARFQKQAADDLHKLFTDKLTAQGLGFTSAKAHVTPRRLALVIDGLPLEQPARSEEKKGPKVDAPSAAIEGFLKSAGLASLDACEQRDTPKGKVWFAIANIPGRNTAEVLADLIGEILREFPWKKSQNWAEGAFRWVRPLRSILALFDGKTLSGQFELGGAQPALVYGNTTEGHRFMSSGKITVSNFADYEKKLRAAHVILDREERKQIIKTSAEAALKAKGVTLKPDDGLLEEVCGLVEWPVALVGKIDDAFMDVPPEVLVTTMRNNQKYFASVDSNGKMSPYFVVISNLETADKGAAIIAGNERVLRARFADAKFFWDLDRAKKLADYAKGLSAITFHAKLGSVADKVARMEKLAVALAIPGAEAKDVALAAQVAKADLVTGMVGEFPELQGIMGGYYARHEKLPPAVASAIGEHYSPLGPSDACPSAPVSVAVALADKLDTLVGFFGIDEKPTGSKDPYALRRAALGVLRLIIENKLERGLSQMIWDSWQTYGWANEKFEDLRIELTKFFSDRFSVMMRERGYRHDIIAAALARGGLNEVQLAISYIDQMQKLLEQPIGNNVVKLYRRSANLLTAEQKKTNLSLLAKVQINPLLFQLNEEKDLHQKLTECEMAVQSLVDRKAYSEALEELFKAEKAISAFFEKVLINCDDPTIRNNRLALVDAIRNLALKVADFRLLEEAR